MRRPFPFVEDDGGRAAAGFRGQAGDCACRAVAIATGLPYGDIYRRLGELAALERPRGGRRRSSAREGVHARTVGRLLGQLGWEWVPAMKVGQGCRVHLAQGELPDGPLVVRVSRHFVAVVGGAVRDSHDPQRGGSRCVYGYWRKKAEGTVQGEEGGGPQAGIASRVESPYRGHWLVVVRVDGGPNLAPLACLGAARSKGRAMEAMAQAVALAEAARAAETPEAFIAAAIRGKLHLAWPAGRIEEFWAACGPGRAR